MPTARPRHFVTETDELAAALNAAALRWPELSRPQLIVRLALVGEQTESRLRNERQSARRELVLQTSGVLTGVYSPGYLAELREDWPE